MKKLFVTQPSLPDLNEFTESLQKIWDSKWITNMGEFHQQFEKELCNYLGVPYISLFANGTIALITALQALKIKGEVITTPFSFVATTHALQWNGIKPVFADIEKDTYNLDPERIEPLINKHTSAILPVHVYGNPCQSDKIQDLADIYALKVIYDAAHAFGVKRNDSSILNYGDLSVLSFHATKPFNTVEGGAIVCHDKKMKMRIDYLKNFGFANEVTVVASGINGKMNELMAAYGLLQLKSFKKEISAREKIANYYLNELKDVDGIKLMPFQKDVLHNYAYFPIHVNDGFKLTRDELNKRFRESKIITRRYFYPLISDFPIYRELKSAEKSLLPVAHSISERILCLPIYADLDLDDAKRVIEIIKSV